MFHHTKHRWLYENQRAQVRVRLASVISGRDIDYVLFFYKVERFGVLKLFAAVKFTDLAIFKDLVRDVEAHLKEMLR